MQSRRQRTRIACEPCRTRKRKCDGQEPCALCVQYGYECFYGEQARKRKSAVLAEPSASSIDDGLSPNSHRPPGKKSPATCSPQDHERHMEANAGTVFPHVLSLKFNSPDVPKNFGIGWNLGLHQEDSPSASSVCSIVLQNDCRKLAAVYFEKVHPVYGFLDQARFTRLLSQRWLDPQAPATDLEPVICGVAALGLLFSGHRDPRLEQDLVGSAKAHLQSSNTNSKITTNVISAWLLRIIYLRATSTPQAAWIASSLAMHFIEDSGLHQERDKRSMIYAHTPDSEEDAENQRRCFWITCLLNTWISNEYGRTKVTLRGVNRELPSSGAGDHTMDMIKLFKISESIDPEAIHEGAIFERCLTRVEKLDVKNDSVKLSQSNLAFALYRRIRMSASIISTPTINTVIRLGRQGIEAALRLANARCPWWHVLNQPFQFLCILLAIDTSESLSDVPKTLTTLKEVAAIFDTAAARQAVEAAQLLIRVSRKRKEQEAANLGRLERDEEPQTDWDGSNNVGAMFSAEGSAWPDGVGTEDPDLLNQMINEFDWDSFLSCSGSCADEMGMM